jgi:hypothetical protein
MSTCCYIVACKYEMNFFLRYLIQFYFILCRFVQNPVGDVVAIERCRYTAVVIVVVDIATVDASLAARGRTKRLAFVAS